MGKVPEYLDWKLGDEYTIEQVAQRLVEMFHAELYAPESSGNDSPPVLGMFVAGYSAHARQAEGWLVTLDSATTAPLPQLAIPFDAAGWIAYAQPEATTRLFNGFDPQLLQQLAQSLPPESQGGLQEAADAAKRMPVVPAMPFMDAISLAKFLVDVTIGYSHYLLGPDTVGGLVEVAGISRHEGFKWVHRKHYYSPSLNPEEPR
jgi:hypothetical protein